MDLVSFPRAFPQFGRSVRSLMMPRAVVFDPAIEDDACGGGLNCSCARGSACGGKCGCGKKSRPCGSCSKRARDELSFPQAAIETSDVVADPWSAEIDGHQAWGFGWRPPTAQGRGNRGARQKGHLPLKFSRTPSIGYGLKGLTARSGSGLTSASSGSAINSAGGSDSGAGAEADYAACVTACDAVRLESLLQCLALLLGADLVGAIGGEGAFHSLSTLITRLGRLGALSLGGILVAGEIIACWNTAKKAYDDCVDECATSHPNQAFCYCLPCDKIPGSEFELGGASRAWYECRLAGRVQQFFFGSAPAKICEQVTMTCSAARDGYPEYYSGCNAGLPRPRGGNKDRKWCDRTNDSWGCPFDPKPDWMKC